MWFAIGINTICTNDVLSGHNWLVRFAQDTNQTYFATDDCILEEIVQIISTLFSGTSKFFAITFFELVGKAGHIIWMLT